MSILDDLKAIADKYAANDACWLTQPDDIIISPARFQWLVEHDYLFPDGSLTPLGMEYGPRTLSVMGMT